MSEVVRVDLNRSEIDKLVEFHRECEMRFVQMREYGLAQEHRERNYLFEGLQKTAWYLRIV